MRLPAGCSPSSRASTMAIRVGCASAWKISALNRRSASGMSLTICEYPNMRDVESRDAEAFLARAPPNRERRRQAPSDLRRRGGARWVAPPARALSRLGVDVVDDVVVAGLPRKGRRIDAARHIVQLPGVP